MASKRHLRRKACDRKKRHDTAEAAWASTRHLRKQGGGEGVRPYHCPNCNGWHIGHKPGGRPSGLITLCRRVRR